MLSLMKKETLICKKYFLMMGVIGVFYLILGLSNDQMNSIVYMFVLICGITGVTTISMDDMAKWDYTVLTLPFTRRQIIGAKYLYGILATIAGVIYSTIAEIIRYSIYHNTDMYLHGITVCLITGVIFFYLSLLTPLIYKFGSEKSRIYTFIIILLPIIIVFILSQIGIIPDLDTIDLAAFAKENIYLAFLVPVIGLVLYALSFLLTLSIYRKKEF